MKRGFFRFQGVLDINFFDTEHVEFQHAVKNCIKSAIK